MLLLQIVHKYVPSLRDKAIFQKDTLLDIQNTYAFLLLFYTMICLIQFLHYQDFAYVIELTKPFPYYFIVDTLLCDPIIYIHHSAGFILHHIYTQNLQLRPELYSIQSPIYIFAFTEVSTFLLTVKYFLEKYKNHTRLLSHLYNINNALFAITFFYIRLYLFTYEIFFGPCYVLFTQFSTTHCILSFLSIYAIQSLNIYWGYVIIQTALQMFTPQSKLHHN